MALLTVYIFSSRKLKTVLTQKPFGKILRFYVKSENHVKYMKNSDNSRLFQKTKKRFGKPIVFLRKCIGSWPLDLEEAARLANLCVS